MRKRRSSLIKHVMFIALVVLSIAGLTGWAMDCHNKRRREFEEEEVRVRTEQEIEDREMGIVSIEKLVDEEYE